MTYNVLSNTLKEQTILIIIYNNIMLKINYFILSYSILFDKIYGLPCSSKALIW